MWECWFRCCGSLVPNGSRSCASVQLPCREGSAARQAGAAPRLSGALREDSGSEVQCRTGTFWGNQGLTGASGSVDSCYPSPRSYAQLRCAAALGVLRCIGYYLRKRSCRHTAAYGSLSLSVCVATLLHSGSTHRHSQALRDSGAFLTVLLLFPVLSKKSKTLFNLIELYISRAAQYLFSYCHHFA